MAFFNRTALILFFGLIILSTPIYAQEASTKTPSAQYAIALYGDAKYPEDFSHFNYVNPNAPKGGTLRIGTIGTFDSLNPFLVKGEPAHGLNFLRSGLVYESLMQNGWDEPFTLYGIIAQSITVASDRSWVSFELRPEAKWSDGKPITAEDVAWTFETLTTKGQPFFKAYWADVDHVSVDSERKVTFHFKVKGNAELPLIVAEMTVLPKHYWTSSGHNFEETSLTPPVTSGPYKFGKIDAPRNIEYVRNLDWWGKDLAFYKGMNNFDTLVINYFGNDVVAHEAFLAGAYDYKIENSAKMWATGYNTPAVHNGKIIKEEIKHHQPVGMQAFVFNIRRPIFQDKNVREAISYGLDFEWSNKQFAYSSYSRTNSFFANSELASSGLPGKDELTILEPLRGKIPEEVFTQEYKAPVTDGTGKMRDNLQKASAILDKAGYKMGPDKIRVKKTDSGEQKLEFELLYISSSSQMERWIIPFLQNLKRLGINATLRTVDGAQFQNRLNEFDFDMTIANYGQSSSPGNEQREFWGSDKADIPGSRNLIGIKDPIIDTLVTDLIHAKSREDLVTKTRALDRILLWNHYVVPMWHKASWWIAYNSELKHPEQLSDMDPLIATTWWFDEKTSSFPPAKP